MSFNKQELKLIKLTKECHESSADVTGMTIHLGTKTGDILDVTKCKVTAQLADKKQFLHGEILASDMHLPTNSNKLNYTHGL